MKKAWSTKWKSSTQPRKQRKYRYNAPLHTAHKFLGCHLSKELRKKYGKRSAGLRKNDKVKVLAGSRSGYEGKIDRIDIKKTKAYIVGLDITKKDGSKRLVGLHPSNLLITELDLSDKRREEALLRKQEKAKSKADEGKK